MKIGLAIRFAQELRMMSEPVAILSPIETEENRRTFWSVFMLDRLVSCGRDRPIVFRTNDCSVHLPGTELSFRAGTSERTTTLQQMSETIDESPEPVDYFSLTIWMASCVGCTAQQMIQHRGKERIPPWNSGSEFMKSLSRLFHSETMIGVSDRTLSQVLQEDFTLDGIIDQQRVGHLLYSQMLFHLCHCLLSHPFLLREKLKALRRRAPSSFLRETFARSYEHAGLLLQLVADARQTGCDMEASFYGYCVCIAGGIQILYLHADATEVYSKALERLQYALGFLAHHAKIWKHVYSMVRCET